MKFRLQATQFLFTNSNPKAAPI